MTLPAAYISYAWGDDKTAAGREREAIVADLCRSFAEVGIVIGRDKNEVKPGDSIEAFGVRIAKAPLILAVISERSLRSEWCMLYELYEAYLRRGGNGKEFAEDVVALVLDDAEPDLDKSKPLVDYWKAKYSEYKEMLEAADPNAERSLESRKVLMKYCEMIESLPDMLLAIRRIAMPRGSASIRRDDFKEIHAYVARKLGGAVAEIPAPPPELELAVLQHAVKKLARTHSQLSPAQLHRCWHRAIEATWPLRSAASLFPQLASAAPLHWADLQALVADPGPWASLDAAKIDLLFHHFETGLALPAADAAAEATAAPPPMLAVLIKPTGDRSASGQQAYRCTAVLRLSLAEGDWQYEPVDPVADHVFCFHPPPSQPSWQLPGAVLGRLWQAAATRLCELGRIDQEPLLDLFLPRDLLDEDWWHLELRDGSEELGLLASRFYRLRSIDRWTKPELLIHKQHFDRKRAALRRGEGHWQLFPEGVPSAELLRQLPLSRSPARPEIVAILPLGSLGTEPRSRLAFLRSALESSAPVVLWWHPSADAEPEKRRQQQMGQLLQVLQLRKPTKIKNHHQPVRLDPFALPQQKQSLPESLVVLIEDSLEMDPDRPACPRLFAAAESAPSLGYRTG